MMIALRRLTQARPITASSSISRRAMSTPVPDSQMSEEDKSLNRMSRTKSMYKLGKHRSNGLELIRKVPVIEVEGDMAIFNGGGGALGHPIEYIKVGSRGGEAVSCIYCGLRYKQQDAH